MKKVTLIVITLLLLVSSGLAQRGGGGNKPPANPAIATSIDGTQDTLKVMNADGSNLTAIYNAFNSFSFEPSWSPLGAGTQINPYSIAFNQEGTLRVIDVAVVNGVPQGLNARILADAADCGGCFSPQWSPLGDEIAVGGEPGLFVVDAVSGAAQVVYTPPAGRFVLWSAWSPDGSQLAFEEHNLPGPADPVIKILDLTTNPPTVTRTLLQGQFGLIQELDWARTQDTLAFTGDGVIYTLNLSLASPVPAFLIEGRSPSWSPDDTKLAFEGGSPQPGLKILTLATGAVKRIVGGGGRPDWRR